MILLTLFSDLYGPSSTGINSAPHVYISTVWSVILAHARTSTALKDAILPLLTPITGVDGRKVHEIVIPKDTIVIISSIVTLRCGAQTRTNGGLNGGCLLFPTPS